MNEPTTKTNQREPEEREGASGVVARDPNETKGASIVSGSIPRQTATRLVVTFTTVQDIEEGRCPVCDSSYYVAGIHIGGHASSVPFVCCMNADGGWTHVQQRISDALFGEYVEHLRGIEEANEAWVKKLNDDLYGEVA